MLFRARSLQLRRSLHLRSKSTDEDCGQEGGVALHDRATLCISLCVLSFASSSCFLFWRFGVPVERGEETHFGAFAGRVGGGFVSEGVGCTTVQLEADRVYGMVWASWMIGGEDCLRRDWSNWLGW